MAGGDRTVIAVIAAVLVAVTAAVVMACGGDEEKGAGAGSEGRAGRRAAEAPRAPLPPIDRIARRIERIRDMRFKTTPVPRRVTPEQTRREALGQLDREYPAPRRAADEEVLKLLGLLAPRDDLRRIAGGVFGGEVAGFYDVRSKRLSVVEGASGGPTLQEITLAHELVHALEDQRFALKDSEELGVQDAVTAYTALIEGTATAVMTEYARRHLAGAAGLGELASSLTGAAGAPALPPYVEASLTFPYLKGSQFVSKLYAIGGWTLVNAAFERPPVSTEQVLHPERYLRVEQPDRLTLRTGSLLGPGWRRLAGGELGEFDTAELLDRGDADNASESAKGWGGGRYDLWRAGPLPDRACPAPCRRRDALVLAWSWDTDRDARQFKPALARYLSRALRARSQAAGRLTLPGGGAAAVIQRARQTTLAFAPTPRLAALLASRALASTRRSGR